jgi:hypothetical protein
MALTATATQGFEPYRRVAEDEVLWVPGDPGDTFTRGDVVVFSIGEGVADPRVADEEVMGRVNKTVVCSATANAMPVFGTDNPTAQWGAIGLTPNDALVEIRPCVTPGTQVYLATFASHHDTALDAYTAGTPSITLTTSPGGNDDPNGALVYVYDGPGKGQWNVIADYDHGSKVATLHRPFATAPTSASSVIILEGEGGGAALGVGFFGRCESDHNNLVVNNGADNGKWMVYADAREIAYHLKNLRLPVILAKDLVI